MLEENFCPRWNKTNGTKLELYCEQPMVEIDMVIFMQINRGHNISIKRWKTQFSFACMPKLSAAKVSLAVFLCLFKTFIIVSDPMFRKDIKLGSKNCYFNQFKVYLNGLLKSSAFDVGLTSQLDHEVLLVVTSLGGSQQLCFKSKSIWRKVQHSYTNQLYYLSIYKPDLDLTDFIFAVSF